jgi:hypothetical protein
MCTHLSSTIRACVTAGLLCLGLAGFAQTTSIARLDTATVIRKSHMKGTPDRYDLRAPKVMFDPATAVWTSSQVSTGYSTRGACRHTNGCTVIRVRTCRINDTNGRVLGRTTKKSMFHNYE